MRRARRPAWPVTNSLNCTQSGSSENHAGKKPSESSHHLMLNVVERVAAVNPSKALWREGGKA